ncbi:hypothetical protein CEY16_03300 [Halalkalibacillus sediminis]|uniref:YqfQ-like protein n=1 Tax=Halalkalibacillus sediminis TaxID=2018042 RepID=A0A2I0QWV1_9BACI|nr:VrrA/YqfQ family protein [Halalkalibacillus sediminis]PKR78794.1 hypothetical protein CEY16_03300 [Halalkalibacillus sediminis]
MFDPYQNQQMYRFQPPAQLGKRPSGIQNIVGRFLGRRPQSSLLMQQPSKFGAMYSPSTYSTFHQTLNHVQKGLQLVQQVTPYVKQYGPMIKNAPMFIDMVKIMMEQDDQSGESVSDEESQTASDKESQTAPNEEVKNAKPSYKKESPKKGNEVPAPKLYI